MHFSAADSSEGLPCKAAPNEDQTKTMEHNPNNRLFLLNTALSLLAIMNPQAVLIALGIISTLITAAHNGYKFYCDVKKKQTP